MAYAFGDAKAPGTRKTQFFDIMASRGIYHDGWFASAWARANRGWAGCRRAIKEWSPLTDKWELYNLDEDWSQATTSPPESEEARGDEVALPARIHEEQESADRRRLWSTALFHPEDAPASPLTEWTFDAPITRMPESAAPKLGKVDSLVTMEVDVPDERERRALRAGWIFRRDHLLREGRLPVLRVQSVRNAAHQTQVQGQAADRQGENGGGIQTGRQDRRTHGCHAEGEWRRAVATRASTGRHVAPLHQQCDL
jgi:hypothetical protein